MVGAAATQTHVGLQLEGVTLEPPEAQDFEGQVGEGLGSACSQITSWTLPTPTGTIGPETGCLSPG